MKSIDDRIVYYVTKVNQFGKSDSSKKRNPYRHNRLLNYKEAVYRQIKNS